MWVRVKDTQETTAILNLSFLMFMNVISLYLVLRSTILPSFKLDSALFYVSVFSFILLFNYIKLFKINNYNDILTEFNSYRSKKHTYLTIIYVFIYIVIFMYFSVLIRNSNS